MADQILNVTIKGIGDFSDVVSNVNSVQKALTKLKLPDKLGDNLSKNISSFTKEYDKYQKKLSEGIKTQGDQNAVDKSLNSMMSSYRKIIDDFSKLSAKDFKEIFNLDAGKFAPIQQKIKSIQEEIKKVKLDPKQIEEPLTAISKLTKAKPFDKLKDAFATNDLEKAKEAIKEIDNYYTRFESKMSQPKRDALGPLIDNLKTSVNSADVATEELQADMLKAVQALSGLGSIGKQEIDDITNSLKNSRGEAEKLTDTLKRQHSEEFSFNKQVQDIDRQIQSYFGLTQMIRKVGDIARDAFNTVKELDAAMTETAVVTNFSVGDMWNMLPTYTEQANKLGATIKDVYEAATLYYQQGLNTNQAMGLANETLKMARIAGMDAAEATDMMTAALRGFNMEINQASAQKVNDIYSQLAAVTASDTREIGTAMEKTASLASSANMDIETTSAFLAQMIETTREAPENLGTAMKTIIARFQEMKKDPTSLVDSEGVAMDVNKVDTALKSIGVALTNSKGEFRDLDDVFLDISKRWDSLSQGQQRYIATTAAGSRQQSRFIAMMSNYDRTMELVNEANNSAGASQKQFEKTMDSMSSKLNQLKNAWDEFTMGLMNNQILKVGVTGLTQFFTIVNKIIDAISTLGGKIKDPFGGITKSALTLGATLGGLSFGKKLASGLVGAGVGWWTKEGNFKDNFMGAYEVKRKTAFELAQEKINKRQEKQLQKEEAKRLSLQQDQVASNVTPKTLSVQTVKTPFNVEAYLEKINDSDLPLEVKEKIQNALDGKEVTAEVRAEVNTIIDEGSIFNYDDMKMPEAPELKDTSVEVEELGVRFDGLGSNIANAGMMLQQFGDKLGPFGGIFSAIGTAMVTVGTSLTSVTASLQANLMAAAADANVMALDGETTLAAAISKEGLTLANLKAAWSAGILKTQIIGLLAPFAAIALAIGLVVAAYIALDKAIETDSERLERLTNTANKASDAYSSLKQETSELKDSLDEIQSNEDSFEGLVAGTTEFNDKLTETNQKIDELIQKYPELNEYLSVDKNGLKHISQEGIDFIKKQQDQLVGNASAQNILQSARLKAEQDRQKLKQNEREIKLIQGNYQNTMQPINGVDLDRSKSLTSEEQERIKQLELESKYLKENVENSEKIATQQALAASFTNIEASDRERLASLYVDSYEAAKKRAEVEKDENKMRQTYADYYGYKYDAASKKILDSNNEEIEIDKEALKGVYSDIVATIDIQASAESLDKIENDVNQKFSKGLKLGSSRGDNILSGVLSGDIETDSDLVKKLAEKNTGQIEESLKNLSDAEMAALMGIKEEEYASNRDDLRKEFAEKIGERAEKTLEAQGQIYEDLGAKMAKSQALALIERSESGIPDNIVRNLTQKQGEETRKIAQEISKLTVEQANVLNNVADKLEENVGLNTMSTFLNEAVAIYRKGDTKLTKDFNNLLSGIKWESASSRLAGYTKAINSSEKEIQNWGISMKKSADEANILGDAFDEFVSGDWQELSENADDFQNSLGKIDGAGILKAAEQSGILKNLLDSGAVSATGVAMALQGIEEGKYSIGEVDGVVLQLISSLNRLEDASLRAHNFISNFDPGIDTGEGEDFAKDNAKKAREYYDNGEWGNQQLEQYIKAAAGEERWNRTLRKNKGDLEATTKSLMKYVDTFKDGFGLAWDQMVNDKTIGGKDAKDKIKEFAKQNKDLAKEFDKFNAFYKDGYLSFEIGELSTDNLKTYFQEIYGVSEEYADLLLQDLLNYSGEIKSKLQRNDLKETIRSDEFKNARQINKNGEGNKRGLVLTDAEIKAFKDAGGNLAELARSAGYKDIKDKNGKIIKTAAAQLREDQFRVYKRNSDERREHYGDLLRDYAQTFKTGEYTIKSLFGAGARDLQTQGKLDLNKLIADTQSKSFDEEQSMQAAYKAYRVGQMNGESTLYEGMEVKAGIESFEDFKAALEEMTESSQWVKVGETIGTQIVEALNASTFLQDMREGNTGSAFDEKGFNKENFEGTITQIKNSGESLSDAKKDINTYLSNSIDKEKFKELDDKERSKALTEIAKGLNELDFKPKEINKAFKDNLGVKYEPYQTQKDIASMGASGKRAYDYYTKNGFGNTDFYNRQVINWGEDPTKHKKNFKNAQSWNWTKEQLANTTSTYMSEAAGFGKDGKEIQIAFTPIFQGEDGKPEILSKDTVNKYLDGIVEKSRDKNGNINTEELMRLDEKGLIMGAFQGKNAEQTAGALRDLEHRLEEAKAQGLDLEEVLDGIVFEPRIEGKELEEYVNKLNGLTTGQKEILLSTQLNDNEKATQFIQSIEETFGKEDKKRKQVIVEATQKIIDGDKEGGQKLLTDNGFSEEDTKKITQQVEVIYNGKIVNKKEFKKSLDTELDKVIKESGQKTSDKEVKVKPKVTTKQEKPKDTTAKVKYSSAGKVENEPGDLKKKIKYTADKKIINEPKDLNKTIHYDADLPSIPTQYASLKLNLTTDSKTFKVTKAAHGKNNYIPSSSIPSFGSAAKGRYGTIGPRDKGGLTLTGEEGFEIAWLPSESRSMILGAGGPQMVNLPNDAVVYTHEQSKDIIKRKGIPAGSHRDTGRRQYTGSNGSNNNNNDNDKNRNKGGSNKNPKKSKQPQQTKEIKKIIDKAGKISVWWDNQTRKVDAVQRQVDKTAKAFDKSISKFGVTFSSVGKDIADYTKKLKQSISLNTTSANQAKNALNTAATGTVGTKAERDKANKTVKKAQKAYDKAKKTKDKKDDKKAKAALTNAKNKKDTAYGNTTAISWDVVEKTTKKDKKGKTKTTKKTVKKKENINLSKYINYDKDLDTYTINQAELNKIKSKNKKTAIKDAAQKRIDDNLSKRNTAEDNIAKAQEALDKLADDVYKTFFAWENSLNKVYLLSQKLEDLSNRLSIRESNEELIETRAMAGFGRKDDRTRLEAILKEERDLMAQQLEANRSNLTANADAYIKSLQLSTYAKRYANAPNSQEAKNDFEAAKKALQFLKETGLNTSETFNYDAAISELEKQNYSEDTINRIKEVLDKINENRGNLVNTQNETLASATAIYSKLSDYQDFISDFENDLLSGLEEQTEKEINKLDKLNSSLSQSFRDLLDNVKQALDERRQREDNIKTEQDISQKQQRLAALRADTSGGHQTEIAQLEKEISEAQQGYQRSLEDQLIDRLQQQGDNAEKQRQRQIELLQAQQEIAKITGSNIEQVKEWLADLTEHEEEIKNAWLSGKGYDEALPDEQEKLLNEWDATWAKYGAYSDEAKSLETAISTNETLSEVETIVSNIDKTLSQNVGNDISSFKDTGGTATEARLAGFSAGTLKSAGYSNEEIAKAGYSTTDLNKAGITVNKTPASTPTKSTTSSTSAKEKALTDYKTALKKAASNKKTSANELKKLFKLGDNLNYSKAKVAKDLAKTALTWEQIAKAAKAAGYSRKTVASWSDSKQNNNATTAAKWKSYATGGLANFTGPAWLDGTPSKPELVLNSTDTRNFIALRDVLSKAMSSSGSTENSYATTEFNININVEKVANDYDVDKIITKVKKEIIQSAGYRNVTQVRSFR